MRPPSTGRNHRFGALLRQLTELLSDEAVPDQISERAGSLLYRIFL